MATSKTCREKGANEPEPLRDENEELTGAFDLGAPLHGWMPKDRILELVRRIDASLQRDRDGCDGDV